MKTYTKTIEETKPRLVITHEDSPESPREWSNLGAFLTKDRNYYSPDGKRYPEMQSIMETTADEATSLEDHMQLMKKRIEDETAHKVLAIYPVTKYEHSAVVYRLGNQTGFDCSNNGFYIVLEKNSDEMGTPDGEEAQKHMIDHELKTYTQYANGEVYGFTLYDKEGNFEYSCWGYYDIDDIRDSLPEEWKDEDMRKYLIG